MRFILAAALLLPLSACQVATIMGESASPWYDAGTVRGKPLAEVMSVSRETMLRQGYKLLPAAADETRLVTEWEVHISPHWREGYRVKVETRHEVLENGGGILVQVRSHREVNNEAGRPTMPEHAQWISASLDEKQKDKIDEPALKLRQLLKFKFETRS